MNKLREFDLYIDIVLIVYMFYIKDFFLVLFFLKGWCDKIVNEEMRKDALLSFKLQWETIS